jgi:hypothetical protein
MRWQKRPESKYSAWCRISGAASPSVQVTHAASADTERLTTTNNFAAAIVHLFQTLLPVKDNAGQRFGQKDFDGLKSELAIEHGGVTAYLQSPAEGLWHQAGETDTDRIVILEVRTEEMDLPRWRKRRSELETRFQDNVVIRYLPLTLV